jgi:uncharacterized membrane protein
MQIPRRERVPLTLEGLFEIPQVAVTIEVCLWDLHTYHRMRGRAVQGTWSDSTTFAQANPASVPGVVSTQTVREMAMEPRWIQSVMRAGRWVFAALFVAAGVGHLVATDAFVRIMPPYLPLHRPLVIVSGLIEITLGVLLLVPPCSRLAAWGLMALLVAVFPANVHLFRHQELLPLPPPVHLIRLPFQGVLILWAFAYTRRHSRDLP